jgi:hypothetical protein
MEALVNQASVLPGAYVICMVDPARKHEIFERASAVFELCEHAPASSLKKRELDRPTGLLLNNNCSWAKLRRLSTTTISREEPPWLETDGPCKSSESVGPDNI